MDYKLVIFDEDLKDIGYKLVRVVNYQQIFYIFFYCLFFNIWLYLIMVDEFILFFYFKIMYLKVMECMFYGLEILIKKVEYNIFFILESILLIKESELQEII